MKKLDLKERLPAFVESLQTNGYKPEIETRNHKIILTIQTESYKEAVEVLDAVSKMQETNET